jgi:putative two-component system response regulator
MVEQAKVLIVDDLPANLELLASLLESEGYGLEVAHDGQEAVEKALASPPDLVIMDVSMPRLSGLDACRRLKADRRTHLVPIVLVTGLTAREDRIQGIAAGCDDFLTKPIDMEQLIARVRSLLRVKTLVDDLEQAENVFVSLANALEAKDYYTRGHSERVAKLAASIGAAAGLTETECEALRRAGLVHDIGKIGTPLEYLNKPGKLTTEEYELVKQHPSIGYDICKPLRTMGPIVHLIRGHHERLDGSGYPDGLKAAQISLPLRCLTIADIFDALTSDRPYRRAMSPSGALRVMREEATAGMWDPQVIEVLTQVLALS